MKIILTKKEYKRRSLVLKIWKLQQYLKQFEEQAKDHEKCGS